MLLMDFNLFNYSIEVIEKFSYWTCLKLLFILALFLLNLYLYFSESNKNNVMESGLNSKNVLNKIYYIVVSCTFYGTSFYSTFLAIKSENYNTKEKNSIAEYSIHNQLNEVEINKSFFLAPLVQKFSNFDAMSKLAVSLLLSNSLLFSALSSIIFVIYGDYLINKYQLEVKYPKLAKIIKLRRKFQRYYLIIDGLIVLGVILVQVIFCIAILLL